MLLLGMTAKGKDNLAAAAGMPPGETSSSDKTCRTKRLDTAAEEEEMFCSEDEMIPKGGGGCFRGCSSSGGGKGHAKRHGREEPASPKKSREVGADFLPAIEAAPPDVTP